MGLLSLLFALVAGLSCSSAEITKLMALKFKLTGLLATTSHVNLGTGFSLGLGLPNGTVLSVTSGFANPVHMLPVPVKATDKFAFGSTTKLLTAVAVLRLVDQGVISSLDAKAAPLMDRLYTKLNNGVSLESFFGPHMANVTVRQLLSMRSGIADFDNGRSRSYQLEHRSDDMGPVKELSFVPVVNSSLGRFSCVPGACGMYSSSNYELLGLLLAQAAGASSWDTYNQSAAFPELMARLESSTFAVHGLCADFEHEKGGMAHGMTLAGKPKRPVDVWRVSCTNGWTCGNLLSTGADVAAFVHALYGSRKLLSEAMLREMTAMRPLSQGWSKGLPYGLGMMDLSKAIGKPQGSMKFYGHGGETYGFNAMSGYLSEFNMSLSIVCNTENILATGIVGRLAYDAVAHAFEKGLDKELLGL